MKVNEEIAYSLWHTVYAAQKEPYKCDLIINRNAEGVKEILSKDQEILTTCDWDADLHRLRTQIL